MDRQFRFRHFGFQFSQDAQPLFLRRGNVRLGEFEFALAELVEQFHKLAAGAELLKVPEADQNLNNLRIERRMHLHIVQQIDKARIEAVAPAVQRVRDAAADVFDRGQRIRDRLARMIDVVIAVVLPESAWGDADAEAALHFLLRL